MLANETSVTGWTGIKRGELVTTNIVNDLATHQSGVVWALEEDIVSRLQPIAMDRGQSKYSMTYPEAYLLFMLAE